MLLRDQVAAPPIVFASEDNSRALPSSPFGGDLLDTEETDPLSRCVGAVFGACPLEE